MIRTYKYRLRPNRAQANALDSLFWQARRLYNAALEQRITTYQETGKGISYPAQWAHFRDQRNNHPEVYGMLNATSTQQLLRRLGKAFSAFFRLRRRLIPDRSSFKSRQASIAAANSAMSL